MGLLSNLFKSSPPIVEQNIQFGRFTDASKSPDKYLSWDKALTEFENEKYIQSYVHFFDYLCNDKGDNVQYKLHQGILSFIIYQGSIVIEGIADYKKFFATARIVETELNNLPLMRYLLEANYELKFTKYGIEDEKYVTLIFDTMVEDSTPHKLYQALKELATEADRKDDILLNRFKGLMPLTRNHIRLISNSEIQTKFDTFTLWIDTTLDHAMNGTLHAQEYPGAISFLLLDLVYKIDYLIKPEGIIKEKLAFCHEIYFDDNVTSVHDKNRIIIEKIIEIRSYPIEVVGRQLYDVNSTFGMSKPEGNKMLLSIIDAQQKDLAWYGSQHPEPYAKAICGYIIGHSLYAYALPDVIMTLLHFYYKVMYSDFFTQLKFSPTFDIKLASKEIKKQLAVYLKSWREGAYPDAALDIKLLDFSSESNFAQSYIFMLTTLKYEQI